MVTIVGAVGNTKGYWKPLNVCYNCVDRHLETKGDDVAIIWEGDDPARDLTITYRELHLRVCKFANALKKLGAKKGDRITIYMPMIPEAACAPPNKPTEPCEVAGESSGRGACPRHSVGRASQLSPHYS